MTFLEVIAYVLLLISEMQKTLAFGFLILQSMEGDRNMGMFLNRKKKYLKFMDMVCLQFGLSFVPGTSLKEHIFKSSHWFNNCLPDLPEGSFIKELRMPRAVLGKLLRDMYPFYPIKPKDEGAGPQPIPFPKILCATLYKLGHKITMWACASKFGISKSILSLRFEQLVNIIVEQLGPAFLRWPSVKRQKYISYVFWLRRGIPGVVSCADGSHIPFNLLDKDAATDFYCRKGFYSIILQAAVDHVPLFTDVYVGWPGSVNDGRVWRNSPLKRKFEEFYNNPQAFPEFSLTNHHLLGDAAYKIDKYMLPPFKNTFILRHSHRRYNKRQSGTRMAVERAFGQAKGKWQTLKWLNYRTMQLNCKVITACCILHNYVKLGGAPLDDNDLPDVPNIAEQILGIDILQAGAKRQQIMDSLFRVVRV